MFIVGQKQLIDLIDTWESMPNFTIIQGPEDTGKTTLLLYMCEHFKINYVVVKNGVNNIRQLIEEMVPDSNTLYHFKDFDRASAQAKNALLKITEEPVSGNYIAITGNTQIKTLESRARKLVINAYTEEEIIEYMQKYIDNSELCKRLYRAGINTPSKIEKYRGYDKLENLLSFVEYTFNNILNLSLELCIDIINRFTYKTDLYDICELYLIMLVNTINYNVKTNQNYAYYEIIEILIAAKETMEKDKTLNRRFILFRAMYSIFELRGKI